MVRRKRQVEKGNQALPFQLKRPLQTPITDHGSLRYDQRYHCLDEGTLHALLEENKPGRPRKHRLGNLGRSR